MLDQIEYYVLANRMVQEDLRRQKNTKTHIGYHVKNCRRGTNTSVNYSIIYIKYSSIQDYEIS